MPVTLGSIETQVFLPWATVSGTYTSVRPNSSNDTVAITDAAKYVVNLGEGSPSYGVYQHGDVIFTIPKSTLTAENITAKPRDTFTVGAQDWTVLDVDETEFLDFVKLTCRDLVLAADLRDTAHIAAASITQELTGARKETLVFLATSVPARFQLVNTREETDHGKRYMINEYEVTIGQDVNPRSPTGDFGVVTWVEEDKLMDVTGYRQSERIDELPVITAVEKL